MRVFVDASAFIAILVETDSNHKRAAEIAARLELEKAELITSSMVVAEVLTVLSMRFSKILALTFGERVMRGDGLAIIHPSALTFEHTWELWKNEKDKDVSFVDAVSFTPDFCQLSTTKKSTAQPRGFFALFPIFVILIGTIWHLLEQPKLLRGLWRYKWSPMRTAR